MKQRNMEKQSKVQREIMAENQWLRHEIGVLEARIAVLEQKLTASQKPGPEEVK